LPGPKMMSATSMMTMISMPPMPKKFMS
jgi:hypothetical protein